MTNKFFIIPADVMESAYQSEFTLKDSGETIYSTKLDLTVDKNVSINDKKIKHSANTFYLKVSGNQKVSFSVYTKSTKTAEKLTGEQFYEKLTQLGWEECDSAAKLFKKPMILSRYS